MSTFGGLVLTNRGLFLQSKAQTGVALKYTRIAVGDGQLGTTSILQMNRLINEVKSLPINKLKVLGEGRAVVGAVLTNQELTAGFYYREIGVFALDPDVGEILYCYGNAGNLAEYIPTSGSDIIEKNIEIQTVVGNATNISAVIDTSLVWETAMGAQEKADRAEGNANTYTNTKIKEHGDLNASTTNKGHVQLSDSTASTSTTMAATANAVKKVNDVAVAKYTKPTAGIPKTDMASDVQASLGKADTALQSVAAASITQSGVVQLNDNVNSTSTVQAATANAVKKVNDVAVAKYTKPTTGIPKTDLASAVQTSLGKADTALQSVAVASTTQSGVVQLNDNVNSTSIVQAATANAVKKVNDALTTHVNEMDAVLVEIGDAAAETQRQVTEHLAESMPHTFVDGDKTYRWGFRTSNGEPQMIYEEVPS